MEASALRAPAGLTRLALPSALLRLRSDEQLVAAFRQGSDEAFRVIHDRYRTRLFAYTRQMLGGSPTDAEDALQDVFLRAYKGLRADDRPVVLKAWLYRVAHNRCIDHLRRPTPPAGDVFDVSRTPVHDPLAEAERREDLRRLIADVQRLPEQQRSALLMRELEGLSYAELAVALDTTVPAVKSLLVRARMGLAEAAEARNASCAEIRNDLAMSFAKGVRASAMARKHMRECRGCAQYRRELRQVQAGLGALMPGPSPLALFAKLLGLGAGGGGAAAGGTAAAGGGAAVAGGGAAVVGGGVVAGTTAKVAAVMCCAAITAGGAVEIKRHAIDAGTARTAKPAAAKKRSSNADRAPVAARAAVRPERSAARAGTAAKAGKRAKTSRGAKRKAAIAAPVTFGHEEAISQHGGGGEPEPLVVAPGSGGATEAPTGGALAPTEPPATPPATTPAAPAGEQPGTAAPAPAPGTTPVAGGTGSASAAAPAAPQSTSTAPTASSASTPGPADR